MNVTSLRHVKIKNLYPSSMVGIRYLRTLRTIPKQMPLCTEIFQISQEVYEAIREKQPVVALETTIYTHGFPYPDNVALASHLESVVRQNGGIPATIGVLRGVARVGLSPEELTELASAAGEKETMKISRRDLPYITGLCLAGKKINGGTTIAGTMFLANLAGIKILGTGGLGGVHRGGEHTMDVSADLTELGRTPVAVVSSGCKSFLDIPRTLEYLETQGVSVSTFADGRTGDIDLPAFWTRESGVKSPFVVENEKEAAAMIYAGWRLRMKSGLFFANPIPLEYSLPKSDIDRAIEEAVQDAEQQGIRGHANTPFILERIKQLTEGKSIPANRALIESNVARATKIAVEYFKLIGACQDEMTDEKAFSRPPTIANRRGSSVGGCIETSFTVAPESEADIIVAGSVAVDLSCDYSPSDTKTSMSVVARTSNPAVIIQTIGGVGHNVAAAAHLIGKDSAVRLCSIVATDLAGMTILSSLKKKGIDVSSIMTLDHKTKAHPTTSQYVAINDANKDLLVGMADMRVISSPINYFTPWKMIIESSKPKWVVVDANWDESAISKWIKESKKAGANVAVEPVSVEKSKKLFPSQNQNSSLLAAENLRRADKKKGVYPHHDIDLMTPNEQELDAIYTAAKDCDYFERQDWWEVIDALSIPSAGINLQLRDLTAPDLVDKGIPQGMIQLLPFIPSIITKLGARGVIMARILPPNHPQLQSPESARYILGRNMSGNPSVGGVYLRHFPAAETVSKEDIVSVNGVGDTFLGVLIAGLAKGLPLDEKLIHIAQRASVMTLKSKESVSPEIVCLSAELGA